MIRVCTSCATVTLLARTQDSRNGVLISAFSFTIVADAHTLQSGAFYLVMVVRSQTPRSWMYCFFVVVPLVVTALGKAHRRSSFWHKSCMAEALAQVDEYLFLEFVACPAPGKRWVGIGVGETRTGDQSRCVAAGAVPIWSECVSSAVTDVLLFLLYTTI